MKMNGNSTEKRLDGWLKRFRLSDFQLFIRKVDYPVFKQLFIQDINLIVLCMYILLDFYLFKCLINKGNCNRELFRIMEQKNIHRLLIYWSFMWIWVRWWWVMYAINRHSPNSALHCYHPLLYFQFSYTLVSQIYPTQSIPGYLVWCFFTHKRPSAQIQPVCLSPSTCL